MSNLTVENVYTRHKAKELARKHFWKLLGMMLIVGVIVYAIYGAGLALVAQLPGAIATTELTTTSASFNVDGSGAPYVLAMLALILLVMLISGGLGLGLTSAMLGICRGDESVTVGRVFSRMGQCLKALGLSLWVGLKTMLWALPVYALGGVATYLILSSMSGEMGDAATTMLMLIPILIMVLVFALVIPAFYRYMLSNYVLADKPDTGIRNCVKESKALMAGHKWQAFKLVIPIILALYGVMIVMVLVFGLLMAALAEVSEVLQVILAVLLMVAFIGLVVYFAIRMSLAYCLFYLNRIGEGSSEEPAEE